MICHHCESTNIVKYGKNSKGNQRYLCKKCFSILVENGSHIIMSDKEKELILKIAKEGVSIQAIARIINRDYLSVYMFLKKNAKVSGLIINKE